MKFFSKKWVLIISLAGLLTSLASFYLDQGQESMFSYQKDLQKHLEQQEKQLASYLQDASFTSYLLKRDEVRYLKDIEKQLLQLEALKTEVFSLFLVQGQNFQLVHTDLHFTQLELNKLRTNQLKEGWYNKQGSAFLLKSYDLSATVRAWAWIPLLELPAELSLSLIEKKSYQPLLLKDYPSIYLSGPQRLLKNKLRFWLVGLFIFIIWLISNYYLSVYLKTGAYAKFGSLLFGIGSLLVLFIFWTATLNTQAVFGMDWKAWNPILIGTSTGPSAILILVQSTFVFWLFTQFYRLFGHWGTARPNAVHFRVLTLYTLSLSLIVGVAYWLKYIILEAKVFFNLEATLQITQQGFLVALSLVLLLLAVFLFVYRLFKWVAILKLPFLSRSLLMLFALILSVPIVLGLNLGLGVLSWILMGFIFLMLFDLLADGETFNFTWLMVWLMMMSAFAASLSYKYVVTKDLQTMQTYSDILLQTDSLNQLRFLDRYAFLVLENGETKLSQQFITDLEWDKLNNLPEDQFFQSKTAQHLILAKRQGQNLVVFQKRLGNYFSPLSLFALFFMLFILVILFFVGIHSFFPIVPDFLYGVFTIKHSLKNRIQLAVIGIVLGSSILIGAVTVWYFKSTTRIAQQQTALATMKTLQQSWDPVNQLDSLQRSLVQSNGLDLLEEQQPAFFLYNRSGQYLAGNKVQGNAPQWMSVLALELLKVQLQPYIFDTNRNKTETLFTTLKNSNDQIVAYLAIPSSRSVAQEEQQLNNFVGSIFSLYVFFMFIAGGIAIWVANSITEPISKIGESLRQLRLESNKPLVWKNEDEIGLLIQQYNLALKKLEESSRQLRLSEREGAWREMAKQVAHEIKNPLTPMKLSVQHLLRAYQMNRETVGPLIQNVSTTLIEQIEGLTKIADEFAHFAKMPKAEPKRIQLNELLRSVVDLYANQASDTLFQLQLPSEQIFTMADKDQLMRVFHNIITNAIQAIPDGREGVIQVDLQQTGQEIKISIADNGMGIPQVLQAQVFYPNFTTKSSGTGIGLSMSRNIIEQFGGQVYFETRKEVGTTFYIALAAC